MDFFVMIFCHEERFFHNHRKQQDEHYNNLVHNNRHVARILVKALVISLHEVPLEHSLHDSKDQMVEHFRLRMKNVDRMDMERLLVEVDIDNKDRDNTRQE